MKSARCGCVGVETAVFYQELIVELGELFPVRSKLGYSAT